MVCGYKLYKDKDRSSQKIKVVMMVVANTVKIDDCHKHFLEQIKDEKLNVEFSGFQREDWDYVRQRMDVLRPKAREIEENYEHSGNNA